MGSDLYIAIGGVGVVVLIFLVLSGRRDAKRQAEPEVTTISAEDTDQELEKAPKEKAKRGRRSKARAAVEVPSPDTDTKEARGNLEAASAEPVPAEAASSPEDLNSLLDEDSPTLSRRERRRRDKELNRAIKETNLASLEYVDENDAGAVAEPVREAATVSVGEDESGAVDGLTGKADIAGVPDGLTSEVSEVGAEADVPETVITDTVITDTVVPETVIPESTADDTTTAEERDKESKETETQAEAVPRDPDSSSGPVDDAPFLPQQLIGTENTPSTVVPRKKHRGRRNVEVIVDNLLAEARRRSAAPIQVPPPSVVVAEDLPGSAEGMGKDILVGGDVGGDASEDGRLEDFVLSQDAKPSYPVVLGDLKEDGGESDVTNDITDEDAVAVEVPASGEPRGELFSDYLSDEDEAVGQDALSDEGGDVVSTDEEEGETTDQLAWSSLPAPPVVVAPDSTDAEVAASVLDAGEYYQEAPSDEVVPAVVSNERRSWRRKRVAVIEAEVPPVLDASPTQQEIEAAALELAREDQAQTDKELRSIAKERRQLVREAKKQASTEPRQKAQGTKPAKQKPVKVDKAARGRAARKAARQAREEFADNFDAFKAPESVLSGSEELVRDDGAAVLLTERPVKGRRWGSTARLNRRLAELELQSEAEEAEAVIVEVAPAFNWEKAGLPEPLPSRNK